MVAIRTNFMTKEWAIILGDATLGFWAHGINKDDDKLQRKRGLLVALLVQLRGVYYRHGLAPVGIFDCSNDDFVFVLWIFYLWDFVDDWFCGRMKNIASPEHLATEVLRKKDALSPLRDKSGI